MTTLTTSKCDLELIIDKEGTEGLSKVYSSLQEGFAEDIANKLGFLEKDFTSDYFDAKTNHALNYLGLTSLFERNAFSYEEDFKTRFRRKEALFDDVDRGDEIFTEILDYGNTSSESIHPKVMLHLQVLDHYFDILTFKHSLDLTCAKGYAEKLHEPDVTKGIESYGSVLKTYLENKKFNKKLMNDKLRILNKSLNDTTTNCLEDILSNYHINNEQALKHFQDLKDRILENKETSFLSMFEEGKRYGAFYWKNILEGTCAFPFLVGGAFFYIGCFVAAAKNGAFFSDYLTGGLLGAITYLIAQYYKGLTNTLSNISSKINQKLINKNERLKEAVINKKKSFSEPTP
ncbi:MAG: hypothetical protein Q8O03_08280 [Nanoarchaeota archaeon]|nr:hypothetical protein [Nanoarchaeota archaeon]